MATLNIDGHSVNVDDSFLKLPPEQQNATVDEIHKSLGASTAPEPKLSDAVTDIPAEIGRTAQSNVDAIKNLSNRGTQGPIEGLMSTGRAAAAIPGFVLSPVIGVLKSLIGHPMAQAEHAVGSVIAPDIAAKDDPQKMYQNAAGDVETALNAARPAGAPIRVLPSGLPAPGLLPSGLPAPAHYDWQFPTTPPPAPVPTVDELKNASRAGYRSPEVAAVEIHPQSVSNLSATIENDLANQGFRPRAGSAPGTFEEVRNLVPPQGVASVRVADLDSARKALGIHAKEVDAVGQPTAEATAARTAINHIDNYLPNLQQPDLVAGDAAQASQILDQSRSNWGAAKRAEQVQTLADNARIQAASTYGGGNINNATRQALRPLLKNNAARAVGYNDAEREALSRAVEGTWLGNTARQVGKLGPDTGLKGIEHIISAVKTGGASIPLSAASLGAKVGGDAATRAAVNNLDRMLRSRSSLAQILAAQNPPRQIAPGGLSSLLAMQPRGGLQIPASLVSAYTQQNQQ
jgi:hypothetical protein